MRVAILVRYGTVRCALMLLELLLGALYASSTTGSPLLTLSPWFWYAHDRAYTYRIFTLNHIL